MQKDPSGVRVHYSLDRGGGGGGGLLAASAFHTRAGEGEEERCCRRRRFHSKAARKRTSECANAEIFMGLENGCVRHSEISESRCAESLSLGNQAVLLLTAKVGLATARPTRPTKAGGPLNKL